MDKWAKDISDELKRGIEAYNRQVHGLGGYGVRIRAKSMGTIGAAVEGVLQEAGSGGCQPCVLRDDGRRTRIDIDTAERI